MKIKVLESHVISKKDVLYFELKLEYQIAGKNIQNFKFKILTLNFFEDIILSIESLGYNKQLEYSLNSQKQILKTIFDNIKHHDIFKDSLLKEICKNEYLEEKKVEFYLTF